MGLPTVAVLEEEIGARDGSNRAAAISADTNDSADLGDDSNKTLEERAKKALECPCLDDLRHGPCGGEFSKAFVCFVKSQQPEKGSDCVGPFEKMQHCMSNNADKFSSMQHSDARMPMPMAGEGRKLASEEDESEASEEDEDEDEDDSEEEVVEDYSSHGLVPALPDFPEGFIKLPAWYLKQEAEKQRSSQQEKENARRSAKSARRAEEAKQSQVPNASKNSGSIQRIVIKREKEKEENIAKSAKSASKVEESRQSSPSGSKDSGSSQRISIKREKDKDKNAKSAKSASKAEESRQSPPSASKDSGQ